MNALSRGRAARTLPVLVALAVAAGVLAVKSSSPVRRAEMSLVDTRFAVRGKTGTPSDVTVVAVDDRSMSELRPRWPYPRSLFARVIDRLHDARARVIAFDLQFSGATTAREDTALLAAARRAGNVVLTTAQTDSAGHTDVLGGDEVLRAYHARFGSANFLPGRGGVIRRDPYSVHRLRSLAVVATELAQGRRVPTSWFAHGGAWIDFAGPPGTVTAVPIARVLDGSAPRRLLAGRVVVVGATAPLLQDRHATPVASDRRMSGSEIHANAISTLLRGAPLRDTGSWLGEVLIVLLALLPAVWAVAFTRPWVWGALTIATGALLAFGVQLAFDAGRVVPVAAPLLALGLAGAGVFVVDYTVLTRERRRLRRQFAQHVPAVVEDVLAGHGAAATTGVTASSIVPGYEFESELGRGGMGVVYLARQLELDRPVAVKLLRPEFAADLEFRRRFEREARLAAAIEHPNVVPVYAAGEHGGLLYVAMRYVQGQSLEERLAAGPRLHPEMALAILDQVSGALDVAHAKGLIHRDVKPANVVLTDPPARHAYLSDFGLARATKEATQSLTQEGQVLGTVDYLAPEAIEGGRVDGRADVYSLGCMLFRMLTGSVPFPGPTDVSKLWAHVRAPIPTISGHDPRLRPLDPVVGRALDKDPDRRQNTAGDLAVQAAAAWREVAPAAPQTVTAVPELK